MWRLGNDDRGVDEMCLLALRAAGTKVRAVTNAEDAATYPLVVIDAAEGLAAAVSATRGIGAAARVIVCVPEVTTEAMGELISAGADVVIGYPIEQDKLERKVRRQLARGLAQTDPG